MVPISDNIIFMTDILLVLVVVISIIFVSRNICYNAIVGIIMYACKT